MRILGLDVGSKRIGIAVSDPLGITAQGLKVITRDSDIVEEIKNIISEFEIGEVVIGAPLNMDGTKSKAADEVVKFADEIREKIGRPIKMWDERLTTVEAERVLIESDMSRKKRKGLKDKLAAQLILQSYLTYRKVKDV